MELVRSLRPLAAAALFAWLGGCAAAAQQGGPHTPHDLPMAEPTACGDDGQPCCTDGRPACAGALVCESNACQAPPPPPCGGEGQACCTDGRPQCGEHLQCREDSCQPLVRVTATQVEITQTIEFELNRAIIRPESHGILDEVTHALRSHPEITRVRVEGNTDLQGTARRNQRLSAERAAAVVTYLREHGVTTTLDSVGYGSSRPLCQERTEECHARNRRVAFMIVDRAQPADGAAAPTPEGGAPAAEGAASNP